jgi:hypothetical protein
MNLKGKLLLHSPLSKLQSPVQTELKNAVPITNKPDEDDEQLETSTFDQIDKVGPLTFSADTFSKKCIESLIQPADQTEQPSASIIVPDTNFGICMFFENSTYQLENYVSDSYQEFTVCLWINGSDYSSKQCVIEIESATDDNTTMKLFVCNNTCSISIEKPEVTKPEVTKPEVTKPEVTKPEVTKPEVTKPEVTKPEVTNPEVTNPEVTNPEVTNPEVTNPEVTNPEVTNPEVLLNTVQWNHVAVTFKNKQAELFINGIFVQQLSKTFTLSSKSRISLGGYSESFFNGKLSKLSIFKALDKDDIKTAMNNDISAQATFKLSYPIEFKFDHQGIENIFYISDDTCKHSINLQVVNASDNDFTINQLHGTADESNYHFMLEFKPGTFEKKQTENRYISCEEHGWNIAEIEQNVTGTIKVFFLYINPGSITLKKNQTLQFKLYYISAGKKQGARGTTVKLDYRVMTASENTLAGTRISNVEIINQRGKKNIPLHVGFSGSNKIINDGQTQSSLSLCIANISKSSLELFSEKECENPSSFLISFIPGDGDFSFSNSSAIYSLNINASRRNNQNEWEIDSDWKKIEPNKQDQSCQWSIVSISKNCLAPGESIHIKIDNIITSAPTGNSIITVQYQNIPGYWDGHFTAVVEKCKQNEIPVGTVIAFAGQTIPQGWLLCDGRSIMDGFYKDLRLILNSDKVPDLRNRFILGESDSKKLNSYGGEESVFFTQDNIPLNYRVVPIPKPLSPGRFFENEIPILYIDGSSGRKPQYNMPPYYVLRYIIKY